MTGFVEVFRDKPLEFAPGEKFAYNNSGYYLLGLIIEKVSGISFAEFLREAVFDRLGMKNSGYDGSRALVPNRADGYAMSGDSVINAPYLNMRVPYSAGALYSTTEDLLLFDQALYSDRLLTPRSRDQMFSSLGKGVVRDWDYGYGWGIGTKFNRRVLGHGGEIYGFSAILTRFPSERMAVIVLSNNQRVDAEKIGSDLSAIVFGEPDELPLKAASDTPGRVAR